MPEPKIDCLPHSSVAREVIRIEIDGEHVESVSWSKLDRPLHRIKAAYSSKPLAEHPTIIFYMHPETLQRILDVAEPGDVEIIAHH